MENLDMLSLWHGILGDKVSDKAMVSCERRKVYGVQSRLWGMLYRSVHFIAFAGDAGWETGGRALYSPDVE
jgi:hypothetical protein